MNLRFSLNFFDDVGRRSSSLWEWCAAADKKMYSSSWRILLLQIYNIAAQPLYTAWSFNYFFPAQLPTRRDEKSISLVVGNSDSRHWVPKVWSERDESLTQVMRVIVSLLASLATWLLNFAEVELLAIEHKVLWVCNCWAQNFSLCIANNYFVFRIYCLSLKIYKTYL